MDPNVVTALQLKEILGDAVCGEVVQSSCEICGLEVTKVVVIKSMSEDRTVKACLSRGCAKPFFSEIEYNRLLFDTVAVKPYETPVERKASDDPYYETDCKIAIAKAVVHLQDKRGDAKDRASVAEIIHIYKKTGGLAGLNLRFLKEYNAMCKEQMGVEEG